MRTDRRALGIAGLLALTMAVLAQQPERPSFEVASIKPGDPNERRVSLFIQPGGKLTTTNASLQMMIGFAYDVRNHQISGGPAWLDSAKFNVEAKAPGDIKIPPGPEGAAQLRLMLQSLLAERFKLVVHRETRQQQVYDLVVDKGGLRMKDTNVAPGQPQGLGMSGRGDLTGTAAPVPLLVNFLSQQLGQSVVDKTGLTGRYDFTLKWTPDPGTAAGPRAGDDTAPPPDTSGPSIFTAVQTDLGLKLQSAKGPVEMLVIDSVEKPDAN
jgi:bla regulator protein BlaR1